MKQRFFDIKSAIKAIVKYDDVGAFEFIFNSFYERLFRIAIFYLKIKEQAEDATSEVFSKLWEKRKTLNGIKSLDKYLFTMCRNQCIQNIRNRRHLDFDNFKLEFNQQLVIDTPESQIISKEFVAFFNEHINKLSPKCRLIYLMVKDDGLKYKEVAHLLNISQKTVENQMSKALSQIRKSIKSYRVCQAKEEQKEFF
ncbi:MAG: RNA polymerase sigma-70 factor [Cyclobacteriaceae bacterium]|nr:RNA polymerase sigma-70 factor [Cyclobacteriaceae bacterium]